MFYVEQCGYVLIDIPAIFLKHFIFPDLYVIIKIRKGESPDTIKTEIHKCFTDFAYRMKKALC